MKPASLLTLILFTFLYAAVPELAAQSSGTDETGAVDDKQTRLLDLKNQIGEAVSASDRETLASTAYALQRLEAGGELLPYVRYYTGYAFYRLYTLPAENGEQEGTFLDSSIEQLQQAVESKPDFAEAHALLGSGYGMKATGIISGMRYGPRSESSIEEAMELAPDNPRVHLIDGIGKFYKPSLFGGGYDHAIEAFRKAIDRFDNFEPASELSPDWGHAEAYAWLGQAHVELEEYAQAEKAYSQALQVKPDYGWVQYQLMPELRERMEN